MFSIGGSEIAAAVGIDPFTTPLMLYLRKLGRFRNYAEGSHLAAGLFLEDGILRWYAAQTRRDVATAHDLRAAHDHFEGNRLQAPHLARRAYTKIRKHATVDRIRPDGTLTFRSIKFPWMTATPDAIGFAEERLGVIDAKNLGQMRLAEWQEMAPQHYAMQLDHYLVVLGEDFSWSSIAALFGGQELRWLDFGRDEDRCDFCCEMSRRFVFNHLECQTPPDDIRPEDAAILRELYPYEEAKDSFRAWPTIVEFGGQKYSPEQFDAMYVEARDQRKHWSGIYDNLRFVILREMRDADQIGMLSGVTFKRDAGNKVRRLKKREQR